MEKYKNSLIAKYLFENNLVTEEDILLEYAKDLINAITINPEFYKNNRFLFHRSVHGQFQ